ncbi:YceI family protein [Altererythrobacter arenosus]|uniref:YceI family protein n=1 Tax=Altererythrobacter arenosus TaxID=3032592 RepID=A0ABY8FTS5_9SPHN|nr:YceI family protein [Altererythrobacter sp. CAU 1644]WFL78404.1 YceI family protein [Altererythrobacter sp. CAU 1644]
MNPVIRTTAAASLFTMAACSQPAPAPLVEGDWSLDNSASSLSFVSVKAGDIGEVHGFKQMEGAVSRDGKAKVTIDLASVDTGIEIRDGRMREFLFDTGAYPEATISAQVDPAAFSTMAVGASTIQPITATIDLRGATSEVETEVNVLRAGEDRVVVSSARPIILDADALGLSEGVGKLQELAGLPAISAAVPVTFSLTFER